MRSILNFVDAIIILTVIDQREWEASLEGSLTLLDVENDTSGGLTKGQTDREMPMGRLLISFIRIPCLIAGLWHWIGQWYHRRLIYHVIGIASESVHFSLVRRHGKSSLSLLFLFSVVADHVDEQEPQVVSCLCQDWRGFYCLFQKIRRKINHTCQMGLH